MRIYVTRHGETEWNKAGKMQGWSDSSLTDKGASNAEKLGNRLKDTEFRKIYCSPLGRALQTADYIKGDREIELVIKDELKEMGFGIWEGMEHERIEEKYPDARHKFWKQPHLYEPVDGETFEDLFARVKKVLDEIIEDNLSLGDVNVLVVTHAVVKKAIYKLVTGIEVSRFWDPPFMHDTSLTVIEVDEEGMRIILEADTTHLD